MLAQKEVRKQRKRRKDVHAGDAGGVEAKRGGGHQRRWALGHELRLPVAISAAAFIHALLRAGRTC